MYRRVAATAALAVASLMAGAPVASAAPAPSSITSDPGPVQDPRAPKDPVPAGSGNVELLNGLNVLPVQACGLGLPILSGVLAAPNANCSVDNDAAQD